jgi:hypothetical protein
VVLPAASPQATPQISKFEIASNILVIITNMRGVGEHTANTSSAAFQENEYRYGAMKIGI